MILRISSNNLKFTLIYNIEVNLMEKNTIGDRLRKLRYSMDLTQEKLGEKADLHYSYIGQVERGDKTPSLKSLIKIADALDISVEELIREETEESQENNQYKINKIQQILAGRSAKELDMIYNVIRELLRFVDTAAEEENSKNQE